MTEAGLDHLTFDKLRLPGVGVKELGPGDDLSGSQVGGSANDQEPAAGQLRNGVQDAGAAEHDDWIAFDVAIDPEAGLGLDDGRVLVKGRLVEELDGVKRREPAFV